MMLRKMMLVSVILAISVCTIDAQNAANNWIFGRGARIQFNPGPTATAVTTINTGEGSSSISDSTGALLFSTDGRTVWDKNNNLPMTNGTGLLGNPSSTHSALIVPCSCDQYFIFTTDALENQYNNGLRYSVVNMTQSGGLGAVTSKNNLLLLKASEKVADVSDGSGGSWAVGHKMGTNQFFSYHIVAGGDCTLSPQAATISAVGAVFAGGTGDFGQGQIKFSPDGNLLALAGLSYGSQSFVELFQFNKSTGTVTNLGTTTARDTSNDGFYGIEFSLDSNALYATTMVTNNFIYRYGNITVNKLTNRTQIASFGANQYAVAALQLAPDGRIYVARRNYPSLYVLNAPNTANGGWTTTPFNLATGSLSQLGLPTMVAGNFSCASTPTPSPTPSPDPCCPPWNQNQLMNTLFFDHSGSFAAPYTVHFVPTPSFNSQMQTYINYLYAGNSAMSAITIAWGLHNQGTGNNPNVPLGPQIPNLGTPSAFTTWNSGGTGNPSIVGVDPNFFSLPPSYPMVIGTWYRVHTGMYLENGQKFFPDNCAVVDINFIIRAQSMRRNEPPVVEISDGKNIIKRLPIKPRTK